MKKCLTLLLCLLMVFSNVSALALSYDDLLEKAATYAESGDYEKAFASYELAIRMEPAKADAFLADCLLHLEIGQLSYATKRADEALLIDPTLPEGWELKCRIDIAGEDVKAFESDALFSEICGVDLTPYAASIGAMYAKAGMREQASQYFTLANVESMDETQKELYRRTLVSLGQRGQAEALGLVSVNLRNTELDSAFESNSLVLVEKQIVPLSLTFSDFVITEDLIETLKEAGAELPDDLEVDINEALQDTEIELLSLSPSGNSGILSVGGTGISIYDRKYHILYPSANRSVEDTYSNLLNYFQRYISGRIYQLLGDEGVEYSPDGRYAAIYNTRISLMQFNFVLDPIIIDLSSGEMILTATYPNKIRPGTYDDAGVVTTATFSSDGRYFYYILYGSFEDGHTRLYRYDLFNKTTELCRENEEWIYYPHLSEIADGSFIILNDSSKLSDITGIVNISYTNGMWQLKQYSHALPLQFFSPNRIKYSANSGYAIMPGRSLASEMCSFQVFRPDDDFDGMNRYFCITKENNRLVALTPAEFQSSFELSEVESDEKAAETTIGMLSIAYPYQVILNTVLSPDGNYLLLNTISESLHEKARHLFLVRLDDFAMREVNGINPEEILVGALGMKYAINIEWNCDTLIIGTKDGIKTYQFK